MQMAARGGVQRSLSCVGRCRTHFPPPAGKGERAGVRTVAWESTACFRSRAQAPRARVGALGQPSALSVILLGGGNDVYCPCASTGAGFIGFLQFLSASNQANVYPNRVVDISYQGRGKGTAEDAHNGALRGSKGYRG